MNNLDKQYLNILKDILQNGYEDENRTDVNTRFVLGREIKHNMSEGFPILTTKRVPFRIVKEELLWFISGSSDIRKLWEYDVKIWDGDWYKNYCKNTSSPYTLSEMKEFALNGDTSFHKSIWDLGPIYGRQWRNWEVPRISPTTLEDTIDTLIEVGNGVTDDMLHSLADRLIEERDSNKPIDQLYNVIETLKENPTSRRMIVNAWNVGDLDKMTLPPCHYGFELRTRPLSITERLELLRKKTKVSLRLDTSEIEKVLKEHYIPERGVSLIWNQRSADFPLGVPFNITSYGILLCMIADEVRMVPDQLIGRFTDCHIYKNQIDGVKEQLEREPKELPTLHVRDGIYSRGDHDFILENYNPHPTIKFPLTN